MALAVIERFENGKAVTQKQQQLENADTYLRITRKGDKLTFAVLPDGRRYQVETPLGDLVRDVNMRSPEETVIRGQLAIEVERAMGPLNEREREVLRLRYGLGLDREMTLEEIGRRLSITRERVRQIEAKAVAKMRAARDHAA